MKVLNINTARSDLYRLIDKVIAGDEQLIIARGDGQAVVVVPIEEWESIRKVVYQIGQAGPPHAVVRRCRNCGVFVSLDQKTNVWTDVESNSSQCPVEDGLRPHDPTRRLT